jgi:hypothetical protein
VNGITGWKRKIKRREKEGNGFYRPARATLKARVYKKLMESESWYKERKKDQVETEDEDSDLQGERRDQGRKRKWHEEKGKAEKERSKNTSVVKAAMFVPFTHGSALAKELRQAEYTLEEMNGLRLKIVEKSGLKLEDAPKSNPWKGQPCERLGCLLCDTKAHTGKNLGQSCSKRNLVYQTHCRTCEDREIARIEEEYAGDQKKMKKKKEEIKLYKYIGETCRSVWERSSEHLADITQLRKPLLK